VLRAAIGSVVRFLAAMERPRCRLHADSMVLVRAELASGLASSFGSGRADGHGFASLKSTG
jgi:hypothetical protein